MYTDVYIKKLNTNNELKLIVVSLYHWLLDTFGWFCFRCLSNGLIIILVYK